QGGHEREVSPSGHSGLDAAARFRIPTPHLGRDHLWRGGHWCFPDDLRDWPAAFEPATAFPRCQRLADRSSSAARDVQFADRERRVEGDWFGAGILAADSTAVPGHRNSRGLRISVARRGHRRPHHVARWPEWQELHTITVS